MQEPRSLDYSTEFRPRDWKRWLLIALMAYPVLVFGMVHLLWAVGFLSNGTRPIQPHHGPDNWVESGLYWVYWVTGAAYVSGIVIFPLTVVACLCTMAVDDDWRRGYWKPLRWFLPLIVWGLMVVIAAYDPFGAFYFLLD